MRHWKPFASLLFATLVVISTGCGEKPKENDDEKNEKTGSQSEDGYRTLELVDFNQIADPAAPEPTEPTWKMDGDVLKCSGVPRGYIRTKAAYRNYTFKVEFMYPSENPTDPKNEGKPPNTGILVHIQKGDRVWPDCLEVQGRVDDLATIKSNKRGLEVKVTDDKDARQRALKPIGEWNTLTVISEHGMLTSILNDTLIAKSESTDLLRGFIGLQSEGFEVHFRNIRLKNE